MDTTTHIKDTLDKLGIEITSRELRDLEHHLIEFETRGTHLLALNGPYLGVYPLTFTDSDRTRVFDIFKVYETNIKSMVDKIPSINSSFRVISDPFNVLVTYLIYRAYTTSKLSQRDREKMVLLLAKLLHYRFFTSIVKHMFPYQANEDLMAMTINSLNRKYTITTLKSWKAVLENRCATLIDPDNPHYPTILTGAPDKAFLYLITDIQTRLRDLVKNITDKYYEVRAKGVKIRPRSMMVDTEDDMVLMQSISNYDTMVGQILNELMNTDVFIDRQMVAMLGRQYPTITPKMLTVALTRFSETAIAQSYKKDLDLTREIDGQSIPTGIRAITHLILQASYGYCLRNQISLKNKAKAYMQIKNVFSSSRVIDPDIIRAKKAVELFIEDINITAREATKSSLRLAIISYLIIRSMKSL